MIMAGPKGEGAKCSQCDWASDVVPPDNGQIPTNHQPVTPAPEEEAKPKRGARAKAATDSAAKPTRVTASKTRKTAKDGAAPTTTRRKTAAAAKAPTTTRARRQPAAVGSEDSAA